MSDSNLQRNRSSAESEDPVVTAVLASYPDPSTTSLTQQGYRHLIAHTSCGEGIYVIRDNSGEVADLTEVTYQECVEEGSTAELNPVYHIHSRYNLYATPGVHWTQIPVTPARTSPGFTIAQDNLIPFAIDEAALRKWIARSDDWEGWLPRRTAETPGHDLSALVQNALDYQVLTGDPRLDLQVNGDDDSDGAGCYVLLHNTHGNQRFIGITPGWSELDFPADENTPLTDAARFHLDQICAIANSLLSDIRTSP